MSTETTQPATSSQARVRTALLTVQLLFGINYLTAKLIVTDIGPAAWAALRCVSAFAILLILALIARRRLPPTRDILYLGFCSLFGVILNQALFLEGIARTTVSHAALMCSQIPLFTLLFALIGGQETIGWRQGLGFAAGLAGVLILLEADRFRLDSSTAVGDLLNLANAACYGLFVVLSRRVMARNDPLVATTIIFAFGSVGMLIYGGPALMRVDLTAVSGGIVTAMVYAVLGATVVTYFLNMWALKRTRATSVALYIFLQPIIAASLGILVLHEALTLRFAIATALVFVALFLRDSQPAEGYNHRSERDSNPTRPPRTS